MSGQDAVVALVAALALGWLCWRWWRSRRRGEEACANCPSAKTVPGVRPAPQPEMLLAIGEPLRAAPATPKDGDGCTCGH